jgi:peptide-methionine (R)-S-oxide reductase
MTIHCQNATLEKPMHNQKRNLILVSCLSVTLCVIGCVDKRKSVVDDGTSTQHQNVPDVPTASADTNSVDGVAAVDAGLIPLDELPTTKSGWRKKLSAEAYDITREKGTEPPVDNKYNKHYKDGIYRCVCCGERLFDSATKYDSGSGWPAFWKPYNKQVIKEQNDDTLFSSRTEVLCKRCGAHLGHVFDDGPLDQTGLRYCINSVAMKFQNRKDIVVAPKAKDEDDPQEKKPVDDSSSE